MKKILLLSLVAFLSAQTIQAQTIYEPPHFDRQDSLRGTITPERAWWDLTYYHLDVSVDIENKSLSGVNTVQYKVLEPNRVMQLDLQEPMQITKITQQGEELEFDREGSAWFVHLKTEQKVDDVQELDVFFSGNPVEAVNPPWDGGITWTEDGNGKPFVASSNQGIGASIWWPNKDHPYDETDSMLISVTIPDTLIDVSNGRLREMVENEDGTKTWNWFVENPINNYGVNINIGDYVHFSEEFMGEKGTLDLDYYVLRENLEKAKKQFQQVIPMMEAFEYWFGPYPFYEDGFKLVEAPYLGMEHQSSVTYGNGYQNGYRGRDLSSSGWGMKFDFIIIHESAHEWFANNITYKDVADMWVHEGFTNYAENLYLDYHHGDTASSEYVIGTRMNIANDRPVIGQYDVNHRGSSDMYYKGANLLHTIRQIADNDSLWRQVLRGLNEEFYHETVTTEQVEEYMNHALKMDLSKVFDQYLRDVRIPTLEYAFRDDELSYRWGNAVKGFNMPVDVIMNGRKMRLKPETSWKKVEASGEQKSGLKVDPNYYVGSFNVLGD